jgi:hypothetical protein
MRQYNTSASASDSYDYDRERRKEDNRFRFENRNVRKSSKYVSLGGHDYEAILREAWLDDDYELIGQVIKEIGPDELVRSVSEDLCEMLYLDEIEESELDRFNRLKIAESESYSAPQFSDHFSNF